MFKKIKKHSNKIKKESSEEILNLLFDCEQTDEKVKNALSEILKIAESINEHNIEEHKKNIKDEVSSAERANN